MWKWILCWIYVQRTDLLNNAKFYNAHYMNHGLNIVKGQPTYEGGGRLRSLDYN
jgi:hypothetical protein